MNWLVCYLYLTIVRLIRVYKWIELQGIKLLFPFFRWRCRWMFESIGVILHAPGEDEYTKQECDRVLANCKYSTLVHFRVKNQSFFTRCSNWGTLAAGECYMDGLYECDGGHEGMVEFGRRWMEADLMNVYWHPWNRFLEWLELEAFNLQTKEKAIEVVDEHYHLGDDLYEKMLDQNMQYTCAYWKNATNLNEAQIDKMHLLAKKLDLKPGMRVLDIGCGWGNLCKFLAQHYEVSCVGVNIAEQMVDYGNRISEGLPVEIRLQDYRDVSEKFDRIVCVGMFEHVGNHNYKEFFEVANRCLKDDGIFVMHCIGRNHRNIPRCEHWAHKYVFPNGSIPLPRDITKYTEGKWVIEDWHNLGQDYAKTLLAWRENFEKNWSSLEGKYGPRFYKMWMFYLCNARSLFLSRRLQLWQVVLSKDGIKHEYRAAR